MIIALSLVIIAGFMMPMHYISMSYQANNITTGTNNTYPIYLTGVPKGNGTYQQLITINNYSKYGINDNGSNIAFYDASNLTHLYAWIQSINATSMQVWIKNYNISHIIDMQILPSFENLFNANGYIGEAPQLSSIYGEYFNAKKVFPYATDFSSVNTSQWGYPASNDFKISDGITLYNATSLNDNYGWNTSRYVQIVRLNHVGDNVNWLYPQQSPTNHPQFFLGSSNGYLELYDYNGTSVSSFLSSIKITDGYLTYQGWTYKNTFSIDAGENTSYMTIPNMPLVSHPAIYDGYNNTIQYLIEREMAGVNNSMPTSTIGTSLYHSIDFKLIGSSTSINWGIFINGTFYNANSSNIYLNMTNGYYNIIVNLPAGYSPIANNVLKVNNTNQIFKIVVVSQNNNSNFSNDIMYAIILASIIIAVALYFSRRN